MVSRFSSKDRNDALKRMSGMLIYRKIRFVENGLGVSPFVIYLLYERAMWEAFACLLIGVGISFLVWRVLVVRAIPTPFRKLPYEGIAGFRRYFTVFIILYLVSIQGLRVGNFNLALVSLAATYLMQLSFYMIKERVYFVWIYSLERGAFLKQKWLYAQFISLGISLPLAALIAIFHPGEWLLILGAVLVGHLWISAAIFAKYGVFPKEMNVAQVFLFILSLIHI